MADKYILDGTMPVRCTDLMTWARWMEQRKPNGDDVRRVAETTVGEVRVSTVFLAIDHSFNSRIPILFETMAFGGPLDQEQERYATWAEAERGHAAMVERVIASLAKEPPRG